MESQFDEGSPEVLNTAKRRRSNEGLPLESMKMFLPQNVTALPPFSMNPGFGIPFNLMPSRDLPTTSYSSPLPFLASIHDQAMSIVMEDNVTVPSNNNNNARTTVNSPTSRFVLVEEPNQIQRKSYKNENRCLLPNPITICPRELKFGADLVGKPNSSPFPKAKKIVEGTVSVKLVDRDGNELPENKAHILESIEGGLIQLLDDNGSANFSLKVLDTSEGDWWRLVFLISYREEGNSSFICEKIYSRQFIVNSNKKKHANGPPLVVALKPATGPTHTETEVWIKGKLFSDKTSVFFDEVPAKVVEIAENLLTVIAPARPELSEPTKVSVIVSNNHSRETYPAEKRLEYTYIPRKD
eukprot:CAMPEP_0168564424 /NCGR_PEP_ID=MMETSP0413-20121227/13242_1 /TAXON_ID=136452 /ORGANISM="Filamoeba nolandi, Strain NC-AS-23-1" /LENGTH=354 /DNA_ID=CAMNT_0008596103 /DNA_START=304 /DNA_END=1368 /DNA_ORIENTATION=+